MKKLFLYKAQRTLKDVEIESVSIIFDEEVPDYKNIEEADMRYMMDAAYLCDFLEEVLPGGTFDRLLISLMNRKASHFKVSHKE